MSLDDARIDKLTSLIKDSFRVRPNQDPIYVDIDDHVARMSAKQHLVVFGRRGSGKSCLMVHYHRAVARKSNVLSVYIDADEIKTLRYPDLLIRLLLEIGEQLLEETSSLMDRIRRRRSAKLAAELDVLRSQLDQADAAKVSDEIGTKSSSTSSVTAGVGLPSAAPTVELSVGSAASTEVDSRRKTEFVQEKMDTLERHLQDYKKALADAIGKSRFSHAAIIVDDFYLISPRWQPDVMDYLHRLLRGTDLYLKVGTVRHRTVLVRYDGGQTIGVELAQDVEQITLDQTFEDMDATREYLAKMLDSMASKVGLPDCCATLFSEEGLLALTLASGGVPRDFLNIFVDALDAARNTGATRRLTPTAIYKGAGRVSYRTKLSNLRMDVGPEAQGLEIVFRDLLRLCLIEKKKTAFLIAQEHVAEFAEEHELIQQLMDFNDSQRATTADVGFFGPPILNAVAPNPPYSVRHDLNMDGIITTADVGKFVEPLNEFCSP